MQTSDADRLLGATRAAGRRTHSILAANSFPMILFGVLALASAPVAEAWSWPAIAVLWLVGSAGFSFYVARFSSYDKTYGSLGAVVILLMWFYVTAYIILAGAELNAEIEKTRARH